MCILLYLLTILLPCFCNCFIFANLCFSAVSFSSCLLFTSASSSADDIAPALPLPGAPPPIIAFIISFIFPPPFIASSRVPNDTAGENTGSCPVMPFSGGCVLRRWRITSHTRFSSVSSEGRQEVSVTFDALAGDLTHCQVFAYCTACRPCP